MPARTFQNIRLFAGMTVLEKLAGCAAQCPPAAWLFEFSKPFLNLPAGQG